LEEALNLINSQDRTVMIFNKDFQRHVLIFGPTGSGKTSTALKAVENSLRKGIPVEILDWKGEYATKFRGATVIRKVKLLEPPDWG